MTTLAPKTNGGLRGWLSGLEDGAVLRFAFYALLAGTVGVLYLDFREMASVAPPPALTQMPQPILPPATTPSGGGQERPPVTSSPELLEAPLEIALASGGKLTLTGTIDPGSSARFLAEIEARGEYVSTVLLDSPGGSVDDALSIGRLIRERDLSTEVANGGLCASSCPLIFAGGTERIAGREAAVGVHQIYAAALSATPIDALSVAGVAMADAQAVTADITRYLGDGGVDPALWLHALETPPDQLYYFSPEEMETLKLVTRWTE
ncbi:hypothetical protein G5575_01845 [Devosia chinhatensis]|uniref:Uncharacterized protein n=1 Tax=Devosia aurantiaca TaxID=2714858 RepID=A0A6M1SIC4_9HYPH|nr:hypothetical protein [Devosia aurantiaca]